MHEYKQETNLHGTQVREAWQQVQTTDLVHKLERPDSKYTQETNLYGTHVREAVNLHGTHVRKGGQ